MHTVFWLENMKGRDLSEDLGVSARIILVWVLGKEGWTVWNGFIFLRIATSG